MYPLSKRAKKKVELTPESIGLIRLLKNINRPLHSDHKAILVAWSNDYRILLHRVV